jgi:hypothetical protein
VDVVSGIDILTNKDGINGVAPENQGRSLARSGLQLAQYMGHHNRR